jgi:hypothetical protein
MPPKARTNSNKSVEKEGRVLLAVSAIKKQEIKSIREAARIFNVSDRTIRRRLNGTISRTETRANCHKLTEIQEHSLVQWVLSMDQRGAAPRPCQIQNMANILLTYSDFNISQSIGKKWVSSFIKRYSEIKTVYSRRYNYQRAKCEDPKILKKWVDLV